MVKVFEGTTYEEWLRSLDLFTLEQSTSSQSTTSSREAAEGMVLVSFLWWPVIRQDKMK